MYTAQKLFDSGELTTSAFSYYQAPTRTKCIIKTLTFCNTSSGTVTVTLHLVKSGDSAANKNMLRKQKTLASCETWRATEAEGHVLHAGDEIKAFASSGTAVTIMGSGIEVTQ